MTEQFMNVISLQTWILLQIALEALLVIMMIILILRTRRIKKAEATLPDEVSSAMENFLKESEKLSTSFAETLEKKKELSVSLLLKLERKINEMSSLLEQAEGKLNEVQTNDQNMRDVSRANPAAPENRELVVRLADKGLSVEEIAKQAKLHKGEVELILDLARQFEI